MKITIDYGKTGLSVDVPQANLRAILNLQPAPVLPDPMKAVERALHSPIGSLPLATLAHNRRSACILICDITRPVPNSVILQPMLSVLERSGIRREEILILVATGLHRAATPAEIIEMVGADIARQYRVESHDARDESAHRTVGITTGGVPALVDRRYLSADLKIATGLIEPHLMAGFSGGRKVVCPGIVAVETLRHFHSVSILESPLATAGHLDGNPVHDLSLEVARLAGCDFILNVALDARRMITGVFGGGLLEAWMEGIRHVRSIARAPLEEPVDIVVTSAAGYPLDNTFYQAVKGLVGAMPAVRKGGTIVMAAAMQEGVGSEEFAAILRSHPSIHDFESCIRQPGYFSIDQWQAQELASVCNHASVHIYSQTLSPGVLPTKWVQRAASPEQAIADALHVHGKDASIAVIPKGPYVLPVVAAGSEGNG